MSLGGFWDALRGANGLEGQIWAFSLIAAVASGIPLLIYLLKHSKSKSRLSKAEVEATPGDGGISGGESQRMISLRQAVQSLDDDLMPVLRQEAQKLDDLEKENEKLRAFSEARSKRRERKRGREQVKHGFWRKEREAKVIAEKPIRRKSER